MDDELDLGQYKKVLAFKLLMTLRNNIKDSEFFLELIEERILEFINVMN